MAITSYELIVVQGEYITADLLCWRRYKIPAPGILEEMLDRNPHLAKVHKYSPFLPLGTHVRIPIDPDILRGVPKPRQTITLFGRV